MGKSIDIEAQIIAPLATINKALKELTIKLEDVKSTSSMIGGQVGPVMSANLQKAIDNSKQQMYNKFQQFNRLNPLSKSK